MQRMLALEKQVSAKKQKRKVEELVQKNKGRKKSKASFEAPPKKKVETSSSEVLSESEEEVKVMSKKDNKPIKQPIKESSSEESSSDEEAETKASLPSKMLPVAVAKNASAAVSKKKQESSDSSDSDSSSDEDDKNTKAPFKSKKLRDLKKVSTVIPEKKVESSDSSSESESEEDKVPATKVATSVKNQKKNEKTMEDSNQRSVPVLPWMRSPVDVTLFEECPLNLLPCLDPRLDGALRNMGVSSLFPVQVAVWQETVGPGAFERDLCINSPTGSGKTLAYALPIVQSLSTRTLKCLRALVVLPTRDLALQVKEVFSAIAPAVGLRVGLAVGQSSIADEISELVKRPKLEMGISYDRKDLQIELQSSVDILVATPGRLMDHINSTKGFTLEHLHYLVVDETDRLLREAYQSWLPTVLQLTRSNDQGLFSHEITFSRPSLGFLNTIRRTGVERGFKGKIYPRLVKMILSATLTQDPGKLSQLDLHHPLFLTTGAHRYQLPEKLESYKLICNSKLKPLYLVALLQDLQGEKCIIFTSSVESTHRLSTLLNCFGGLPFKISEYSGLQHQSVRSKTLNAFREGEIEVLVASDAMTRGMDVEGVRNVINYDMPAYIKTYIHRAGRTARAGQSGRCFTLLRKDEVKRFKKLLQKAGNNSCSVHSLPTALVECLHPNYSAALEKLKEIVESETSKQRSISLKSARAGKG